MLARLPTWPWCTLALALGTATAGAASGGNASAAARGLRLGVAEGDDLAVWPLTELIGRQEIPPRPANARVSIEFYYLTTCPHCLTLIQRAVSPLIEAQLPGDKVQLTILPVLKGMSNPRQCMETGACHFALAPLCALKGTLPQPSPADSPELRRAVQFMACDISFTAGGLGHDIGVTQDCARKAGLEWDQLDACTKGHKVFDIMYSTAYAKTVVTAMHRLRKAEFDQPPSMPWIFLDEKLLTCGNEGCIAVQTPFGTLPLPRPGSLLALVCAKLDPLPEACKGVHQSLRPAEVEAEARMVEQAKRCASCVEVGAFRWHTGKHPWLKAPLLLLGMVFAMASVGGVLARALCAAVRSALRSHNGSGGLAAPELRGQLHSGNASLEDTDHRDPELATE